MEAAEKTEADSTTVESETKESNGDPQPERKTNGTEEAVAGNLSAQLEEKIIRQVEYYFGDRNLPRDKFLQSAISESEGGWVPISTLLTFNRLKALSSDHTYIISALRKTTNNILEINNEGTAVRRSPDNPPPDIFSPAQRQKMKEKTVYVKGFGVDSKLDDLQAFFDKYGKLEHIQMRRDPEKKFKGSVFVEFKLKEDAKAFLDLPSVTSNDVELIKESKEAYHDRKTEERKKEKETKKASQAPPTKVQTKGAVLHFKGAKTDTTREDIKAVLQEFASVAFIEFTKGDTEGYVRFGEENGATKALEGLKGAVTEGGSPQLCGADVELKVLEGSEEEEYWTKAFDSRKPKRGEGKRGRGGRPRHGNQGARGGKKRSSKSDGGDDDDAASPPVTKQQKVEEENPKEQSTEKTEDKEVAQEGD